MAQTLDQKRAEYAWQKVGAAPRDTVGDYASLAKGAPALVMNSGLMQSLAFLRAKDKPQHLTLLDHLCRWLGRTLGDTPVTEGGCFPREQAADFTNVMAALHAAPSALYLRATDETLALLRWISQFADARKAMEG
jgi:CRISPR-associated protein Cmr5